MGFALARELAATTRLHRVSRKHLLAFKCGIRRETSPTNTMIGSLHHHHHHHHLINQSDRCLKSSFATGDLRAMVNECMHSSKSEVLFKQISVIIIKLLSSRSLCTISLVSLPPGSSKQWAVYGFLAVLSVL